MTYKHPLTDVFNLDNDYVDIEKEYQMVETQSQTPVLPTEAPIDVKDADDIEIEQKINHVYDASMEAFNNLTAYTEIIEPRYAARNAEVAASYLNIALSAANSRAKAKTDRKRANQVFVPHGNGNKSTTNVIMASREDILKMITVDTTPKEIK